MKNENSLNVVPDGDINTVIRKTVIDSGDCFSQRCEGYLVCYHEITEKDFEDMRKAYFSNGTVLNPTLVTINLSAIGCDNHLEFSFVDSQDDNDVSFVVKTGPPTTSDNPVIVSYSLSLFHGIINLFNPTQFLVSKAIDNFGTTAVLKVMNGTNAVYFCDLSHDFPVGSGGIMNL